MSRISLWDTSGLNEESSFHSVPEAVPSIRVAVAPRKGLGASLLSHDWAPVPAGSPSAWVTPHS